MKTEIGVVRALGAVFVERMIRLYTIVGVGASALVLLIIWVLANFVNEWWWLLLLVYIPIVACFLLVRVILKFLAKRIYSQRINKTQRRQVESFVDTVQGLLEARVMGWPLFVAISIKDLVLHRELRSLKKLISDTTGLGQAFNELKLNLQN